MRILVTGANGFIAGHLIRELAPRHELFALARGGPEGEIPDGVHWIDHDLTLPLGDAGLPSEIGAVVHLAQSRHYKEFPERADDIFAVNVEGTFRLLEYARAAGADSFVFASTGGVYGHSYEKFVETDPVSPIDFYLTSKYAAELLIANYKRFFRTIVLRLFFVYGPGEHPRRLVASVARALLRGEPALCTEGFQRRDYLYVDDVAAAFVGLLESDRGGPFNVGSGEAIAVKDLIAAVGEATGRPELIRLGALDAKGEAPLVIADTARIRDEIGWSPAVSLEEGIPKTVEWWRNNL